MTEYQRLLIVRLQEAKLLGEKPKQAVAACLAERDLAWAICERLVAWSKSENEPSDSLFSLVTEAAILTED